VQSQHPTIPGFSQGLQQAFWAQWVAAVFPHSPQGFVVFPQPSPAIARGKMQGASSAAAMARFIRFISCTPQNPNTQTQLAGCRWANTSRQEEIRQFLPLVPENGLASRRDCRFRTSAARIQGMCGKNKTTGVL
jgi:hypothetical protein